MAQHENTLMDIEDYLMLDRNSSGARYEYLEGELVMLAGCSTYHSAIISNLTIAIGSRLEADTCWIFNSDIRLQLAEHCYVHPDISVSCDPRDHELEDMIHYPTLVIEVLSPNTEAVDKIKKLTYYQECATIQEYVMVDSLSVRIEIYHRERDGWTFRTYGQGDMVRLESIGVAFAVDAMYRGMKLSGKRSSKGKS